MPTTTPTTPELKLSSKLTKSLTVYTEGLLECFEQANIKSEHYTDAITETDRFPRLQKIPVAEWMIGWLHGVAEAHGVPIRAVWYAGLCLVGEKVSADDKAERAGAQGDAQEGGVAMDILDKHDLLNLLRDPELKRGRGEPLDPLVAALEQFFTVEIPARELRRTAGGATARNFRADTSPEACAKLAREISETIHANHLANRGGGVHYNHDGVVAYLTDILGEAFAGRMPVIDPVTLPPGVARGAAIAERRAAGKKPARARKAKRWAGRMGALVLIALAACGAPADDDLVADDVTDADAGDLDGGDVDAGPDGGDPDAGPGLAQGSDCDPTIDECAIGLACRVVGFAPVAGRCELAGPVGEGEHCALANGDADCGAAMACLGSQPNEACYLICDRSDPAARCGAGGTCAPAWGESVEIGACAP